MLDLMRGWKTHIILVYHQEWSPINQLILELLTTPLTAIIVSTPIWIGQIPRFLQLWDFNLYVSYWENWLLTRIKAMWFSWSMVNKNLWCMREICKIAFRMVWLVGQIYIQPLICPDLIYNVNLVTGSTMLAAWVNCRLWWNWWLLLMSLLGTIPQQGCHQTIKVAARWQRRSVFLPLSSTPHPPTRHPFAHPTPQPPDLPSLFFLSLRRSSVLIFDICPWRRPTSEEETPLRRSEGVVKKNTAAMTVNIKYDEI